MVLNVRVRTEDADAVNTVYHFITVNESICYTHTVQRQTGLYHFLSLSPLVPSSQQNYKAFNSELC